MVHVERENVLHQNARVSEVIWVAAVMEPRGPRVHRGVLSGPALAVWLCEKSLMVALLRVLQIQITTPQPPLSMLLVLVAGCSRQRLLQASCSMCPPFSLPVPPRSPSLVYEEPVVCALPTLARKCGDP